MKKHLLCLLGTNPLPIWVTCINLKEEFSEGTLIHTETEGIGRNAERLQKELESEGLKFKLQVIDKADPRKIRDTLSNMIDDLAKSGVEHIELSYTGGTKAMAVYSWETLTNKGKEKGLKVSANYLDSKSHQIIGNDGLVRVFDARKGCTVDLYRMMRLHGYDEEKEKQRASKKKRNMGYEFGRCVLKDKESLSFYQTWKSSVCENQCDPPAFIENRDFWAEISSKMSSDFFTGHWLGCYALTCLNKAIENLNTNGNSLPVYSGHMEVKIPGSDKDKELDVLALLGYQLIAISCSTSKDEKTIKLKGFEVLTRARQLGGDEAQAIMLSLLECTKAKNIEDDLKDDIGGAEPPLRVWGMDKLLGEELTDHFEEYIETLTEL